MAGNVAGNFGSDIMNEIIRRWCETHDIVGIDINRNTVPDGSRDDYTMFWKGGDDVSLCIRFKKKRPV